MASIQFRSIAIEDDVHNVAEVASGDTDCTSTNKLSIVVGYVYRVLVFYHIYATKDFLSKYCVSVQT